MDKPLRIEPHHFVEIICDMARSGHETVSHSYEKAAQQLAEKLRRQRNALLEITLEADDLCQNCKHLSDNGCELPADNKKCPTAPSSRQLFNRMIDQRWLSRLGLSDGDSINAENMCQLLEENIDTIPQIYCEQEPSINNKLTCDLRRGIESYLHQRSAAQ